MVRATFLGGLIIALTSGLIVACRGSDSPQPEPANGQGEFVATEREVKSILDKMLSYENPEADYPAGAYLGYAAFGVCTVEMNRGFEDCPIAQAEFERQLEVYAVDKVEFTRGYLDGSVVGIYCGDLLSTGQLPPDMKYKECIYTLLDRFY